MTTPDPQRGEQRCHLTPVTPSRAQPEMADVNSDQSSSSHQSLATHQRPPHVNSLENNLRGSLQKIPAVWMLVFGLASVCVCLMMVIGILSWSLLRKNVAQQGTAQQEPQTITQTTRTPPVGTSPSDSPSLPAREKSDRVATGLQPLTEEPGVSTSTNTVVPVKDDQANQSAQLLPAIVAQVPPEKEGVNPLPQSRLGKAPILGTQGSLDTLSVPIQLGKGLIPFLYGLDLLASARPADAITKFNEAIEADAENSSFYTARGAAYVLSEKMEKGLPDLERAMKLDPKNILASRLTRLAWLMVGDQLKASKFFGHGGHDSVDFLITEVGVGYGQRAMAARMKRQPDVRDQMKINAALQKLPTLMRLVANSFRNNDEQSAQGLFSLGVAQINGGDFAAARRCFESVIVKYPYDWTSRYYYARCLLETGDPELARAELTYLLCWSRFLPEAFAMRSICAAKQHDLRRAEKDLATVRNLDHNKAAEAEAALKAMQSQPRPAGAEAEAAAWDQLLADAKRDDSFEDLTAAALKLRGSIDARRRRWNESYQARLFELVSAARAHPGNADHLAETADFLRDNHEVQSLQIIPNSSTHFFRRRTEETSQWEVELAYSLIEEALQSSPKHARSWAIKSAILLHSYRKLTEAEKSAEYAVQFDPKLVAGHMALSDCYKEYAVRLREKAAALRAPKPATRTVRVVDSKGNFVRNETQTVYIPASPEELAQAAECDRQAEMYEQKEQSCLNNALASAKGTKQEPFYQALLLYLRRDYQGARGWLEKAVAQNPEDPIMRQRLSNCLKKLGLDGDATEEFARAVNLQQTTAEVWLAIAWNKLERTSWKDAGQALLRARALDPADARIAAYQSVLDEFGHQDKSAAQASVVMALAQEEARARANQNTFLSGADPHRILSPEDLGLTMLLRLKLGKSFFATKPAAAASYYLATAGNEPLMSEWNLAKSVPSAMLPYPDRDPKQIPTAPPLVALLKNNRIYAGQALLNAGQGKDAAAQFAAAENFANRLPAGGTAYLEFELESQYVPFRVSSMPIYVKLLNGATLIQQGKTNEARIELQQVRYYLANRTLEQRQMTDDPIPAMYERLALAVGLR